MHLPQFHRDLEGFVHLGEIAIDRGVFDALQTAMRPICLTVLHRNLSGEHVAEVWPEMESKPTRSFFAWAAVRRRSRPGRRTARSS